MTKNLNHPEINDDSPSETSLQDESMKLEEGKLNREGVSLGEAVTSTTTRGCRQGLQRQSGMRHLLKNKPYNWRKFFKPKGISDVFHWLVDGFSPDMKQSDEEMLEDLNNTALLLSLLREYYDQFGMPDEGGPKDQEYVLREVTKDLYSSGCPIWALENVMQQCSEGLTGNQGVDFFVLPRKVRIQN